MAAVVGSWVKSHLERITSFPREEIIVDGHKNGGERGIRTLERDFSRYSLSRRAPSADSAISPHEESC